MEGRRRSMTRAGVVALAAILGLGRAQLSVAAEPRDLTFVVSEAVANQRVAATPEGRAVSGKLTFARERIVASGAVRLALPLVWESMWPTVSFRFAVDVPRGSISGTKASVAIRDIEVGTAGGAVSLGLGEGEIKHRVMETLVALAMGRPDVSRVVAIRYDRVSGKLEANLVGSPIKGHSRLEVLTADVDPGTALVQVRVW